MMMMMASNIFHNQIFFLGIWLNYGDSSDGSTIYSIFFPLKTIIMCNLHHFYARVWSKFCQMQNQRLNILPKRLAILQLSLEITYLTWEFDYL